jgi:hypothetical protein
MPAQGTRAREQGLKRYQVLVHTSIPLPGENKDRKTFLAEPGETVELTEEQAHNLLNLRVPVIRPEKEGSEPLPRLRGIDLSGRLRVPTIPQGDPNYDGPRPDPKDSSHIQFLQGVDPKGVPELNEPEPGSQNAIDLPPGTRITDGLTRE